MKCLIKESAVYKCYISLVHWRLYSFII